MLHCRHRILTCKAQQPQHAPPVGHSIGLTLFLRHQHAQPALLFRIADENGQPPLCCRHQVWQAAWEFQTDGAKKDPLKVLNSDGTLNQAAFTLLFNDFEDMYIDFYRFVSIGAIMSSPIVDHGTLYLGRMDGNLYALQ
jgi:hypothetical protein